MTSFSDDFALAYYAYRPFMEIIYDAETAQKLLKASGVLEFRVLPTRGHPEVGMDLADECLKSLEETGPKLAAGSEYIWCEIKDVNEWMRNGDTQLSITDAERRPVIGGRFGGTYYVLASNRPGEAMLCARGEGGWRVEDAKVTTDVHGRAAIGFTLDKKGGELFFKLTGANIDRPLCILLDGKAVSAPIVQSPIRSRGIITARFTRQEAGRIANTLRAGVLPARLLEEPISVEIVGPRAGPKEND